MVGKDVYFDTISRMEPEVAPVDAAAFYASAAISLKRMADAAEKSAEATISLAKSLEFVVDSIREEQRKHR